MEPTIYLFFNGTCLEAMTHYAATLGGEVLYVFRNGDAPDAESRMPGGDHLVMNMMVKLGAARVMASDTPDSMHSKPQGFAVSIAPPSLAEFDRVYGALAKDARSVEMPPGETFWAERFAMFTDRFGTPWMLNYEGAKAAGAAS
ncbi:VOC family protein [Azospirillum isscasi]|uniref:VOC family protein n=1 Tax=Azospirillum isscasi TaxID=3053926 RepID=A0ABU0WD58_9PROT|nr:VOC family protein [Azospirillum isscasi]MDQ2102126.1 VOC family protein [Azospirillum isscasi]